jgi:hypothetical protein
MSDSTTPNLAEALAAEQQLNASRETDLTELKARVAALEERVATWLDMFANHIETLHVGGER